MPPIGQSEELTAFYQSYAKWLDEGAPQDAPHSRRYGLCYNLQLFYDFKNYAAYKELIEQLRETHDGEAAYPFDEEDDYWKKCADYNQHLNPKRIIWVKEHI